MTNIAGAVSATLLSAQNKVETKAVSYKEEMQSLQAAIQKNFYDKASGYYFVDVDPAKREKKGDYLREYTYLWSLCAMFQAASLADSGQQTPIVVVVSPDNRERYLLIEGHQRVAALEQLGRDTVEATVWPMSEAEALRLTNSLRSGPQESALEHGSALANSVGAYAIDPATATLTLADSNQLPFFG